MGNRKSLTNKNQYQFNSKEAKLNTDKEGFYAFQYFPFYELLLKGNFSIIKNENQINLDKQLKNCRVTITEMRTGK